MDKIEWDEALSLDVPEIDAEHKQLVDCYNELFRVLYAADGASHVNAALTALIDHTEDHFRNEEALMRRIGYPGLAAHAAEHQLLLSSVMLLRQRILDDGTQLVGAYRFAFLRAWLLNHMLDADKRLAMFILCSRPIGDHVALPAERVPLAAPLSCL